MDITIEIQEKHGHWVADVPELADTFPPGRPTNGVSGFGRTRSEAVAALGVVLFLVVAERIEQGDMESDNELRISVNANY